MLAAYGMKRLAVLVTVVAMVGCTTHKDLRSARDLAGQRVTVDTGYGRTTAYVQRAGNEATFIDTQSGVPIAPTAVVRVEDKSHALGAGQGLLIGGGLGFVGGMAMMVGGDDDDLALIMGMYVGAIGSLAGLVVGAIVGRKTIYESKTSGVAVEIGGPSGSTAGLTVKF